MTSKPRAWVLPAIVALALVLRLAHFFAVHDRPFFAQLAMDSQEYDRLAQVIASGHWIGSEVFFQAPLYPYVLAVVYKAFGHSTDAVYLLQIAASLFGIFALYRAVRTMGDERLALIAAALAAAYGPFLFYDVLVLKESLAVTMAAALLWALASPGTARRWLGAGVILGILAMLRENAVLLIPFLLLPAFRPDDGLRGFVRRASAFVAGVALAMSPVAVHNGLAGGSWLPTGSSGGLNFYLGNNEKADGTWRPLVPGKQIPALERAEPQRIAEQGSGRKLTPGEVSSFWLHRSLRWAKAHPLDFVRLQFRKLGHYFDWYEQPDAVDYYWVRSHSPVYRLPLVEFSTVTLLAVFGLFASRRNLRRFAPSLLFAAGWIVSTVVFFPFARYRLPLVPAILPLCALPVAATWDAWRLRAPRRFAGVAALAAAFSCSLIPFTPKMDLVYYNLARLAEERGDDASASREYQAAYDADPTNFLACLNLGNVAVRHGDWPTALRLFREARALEPGSDDVEANLGGALLATGALDEAAVHFEAALKLNPQNRGALHNDALLLIRQGDVAGARAIVNRMLALDPADAGAIQLGKKLDSR